MNQKDTIVTKELKAAIRGKQAVVALESAIISYGLTRPNNLQTALECERIVANEGAIAATVGIINGRLKVGLANKEIEKLSKSKKVVKTNLSNLACVMASGKDGATTVSATLLAAKRAGIKVVATGGVGGIHRKFEVTRDVSADLSALSRYQAIVVCSGVKSILDVGATVEMLEALGIPLIGYRTKTVPLFYSCESDFEVDYAANGAQEIASIFNTHIGMPGTGAIIVGVPIPRRYEISASKIEQALKQIEKRDFSLSAKGRDVTPIILNALEKRTRGATLRANIELIKNNVRVAAKIAKALIE
jgi:pseudouridine-5'-phosphate glycosidase